MKENTKTYHSNKISPMACNNNMYQIYSGKLIHLQLRSEKSCIAVM